MGRMIFAAVLFFLLAGVWLWDGSRRKEGIAGRGKGGVLLGWFVLVVALGWFRLPWLVLEREFNVDESQTLAGAITLARHSLFWRDVDGTTVGPLPYYLLTVWRGLVDLPPYVASRLLVVVLEAGLLFVAYRCIRLWTGEMAARIGVTPLAALLFLPDHVDLLHFAGGHVTALLLAGAFYGICRAGMSAVPSWGWPALVGIGLGLVPWSKLQGVPIAAVLFMMEIVWVVKMPLDGRQKRKILAVFGLGLVGPSTVFLGLILGAGLMSDFVARYILCNLVYAGTAGYPLEQVGRMMLGWGSSGLAYPVFVLQILMLVLAGGLMGKKEFMGGRPGWVAWFLMGASLLAVLGPQRPFLHYVVLLYFPGSLLAGLAAQSLIDCRGSLRNPFLGAALVVLALTLPKLATSVVVAMEGEEFRGRQGTAFPVLGDGLLYQSVEGGAGVRLAVWGYQPALHVLHELPQATRTAHTYWEILPSPVREHHRGDYLRDIMKNRPVLFVDTTGPADTYFVNREKWGHENFPELAAYLSAHYEEVAGEEAGPFRIFARKRPE